MAAGGGSSGNEGPVPRRVPPSSGLTVLTSEDSCIRPLARLCGDTKALEREQFLQLRACPASPHCQALPGGATVLTSLG
jgi:hypothetical protein